MSPTLLLLPLALLAPPDGVALRAAALDARAAAEAELADFRARRVDDHAALVRRVHAAQGRLSRARAALAEAQAALEDARVTATRRVDAAGEQQAALDALEARLAEADGVSERLARLARRAAVFVEPGALHDRRGRPATAPIVHLGPLRWAVGDDPKTVGLLDGAPLRIGGPPIDPPAAATLRRVAAGEAAGVVALPIDLSGEMAGAEAGAPWTVWRWLRAGGPFVWPILALALAALLVVLDRIRVTVRDRAPPGLADAVFADLARGDRAAARDRVAGARSSLGRLLAVGVDDPSPGAIEAALAVEDLRLDRGLRLLAVFAAVAPLLGLLGTVSGMIGTFDVIAVHGTGEPRLLSGGIAQALTTTQLGLMVAVPALLAHAVAVRGAERRRADLEAAASRLVDPDGEGP